MKYILIIIIFSSCAVDAPKRDSIVCDYKVSSIEIRSFSGLDIVDDYDNVISVLEVQSPSHDYRKWKLTLLDPYCKQYVKYVTGDEIIGSKIIKE